MKFAQVGVVVFIFICCVYRIAMEKLVEYVFINGRIWSIILFRWVSESIYIVHIMSIHSSYSPLITTSSKPLYYFKMHVLRHLLFVILPFFFWPLCCLSFDLRVLITPLGSSKLYLESIFITINGSNPLVVDFERTWRRFFQKRVVLNKVDIYCSSF